MIPDVLFDVKYNLSGTLLLTEQLLVLELTFQNDFFRKAFKFFFTCDIIAIWEKKMNYRFGCDLAYQRAWPEGLL